MEPWQTETQHQHDSLTLSTTLICIVDPTPTLCTQLKYIYRWQVVKFHLKDQLKNLIYYYPLFSHVEASLRLNSLFQERPVQEGSRNFNKYNS